MQENDFERTIREKMDGLQLVPSDEVWKRVSANIKEDKKRRRFFWFLLLASFLAGSGGLYLYLGSTRTQTELTKYNNPDSLRVTNGKIKSYVTTDRIKSNVTTDQIKSSVTTDQIKSDVTIGQIKSDIESSIARNKTATTAGSSIINTRKKQEPETKNEKLLTRSSPVSNNNTRRLFNPSRKNTKVENQLSVNVTPTERITQAENEQTLNNKEKRTEELLADKNDVKIETNEKDGGSIKPDLQNENVSEAKKDSVKSPIEAKAQKIKDVVNKKWSIGFTIFSGISDNHSGFPLFPYASAASASLPTQSPTTSVNAPVRTLNYKGGFSYGFGTYLKSSFGKRTAFSAGLNYHYLSAASLVGNRNSGSQTFYANLQYSATVNQYFNNGESVKYTNSYHLVELPLNFLLQLNKKQNKAVFITAGFSPAYLAKSNALYASSSQNIYYATSDQFKKWQFAAQAGLQVNIMNTRQLGITAGPQLQYGLNNMTKQVTGTSQHLVSASLKLNVNLK